MTEPMDPIDLATSFLALNADGFRDFWGFIQREWNDPDSDIEGQWFYCAKNMRGLEGAVIAAIYQAVIAGKKEGKK